MVVDDQEVVEVRGQPDSHWAYVVALMTRNPVSVEPGNIRLEPRREISSVDLTRLKKPRFLLLIK